MSFLLFSDVFSGQFRFCLVQPIFSFEMVGWARQCLVWFSCNACGCNNFVCTFCRSWLQTSHNQSSDRQRGVALDCLGYLLSVCSFCAIRAHNHISPFFLYSRPR